MRGFALVALMVILTGCGTKSVVQNWPKSEPAMAAHNGPVCLLPAKLPDDVGSTFLGRAVANQQWYGGFSAVNSALANAARSVGADVVSEKRQKMKIGFIAWVRPQVWGWAMKLDDPNSFDCVAHGGTIDPGTAPMPASRGGQTVHAAAATSHAKADALGEAEASGYDECMSRVMRITDPALRVEAMSVCDGAADADAGAK